MGQNKTRTKGIYSEADGSKTISKTWKGERIFIRLGTVGQQEAEEWLRREIERRESEQERRARAQYLFAECSARYLEESVDKASVDTIAYHIATVVPFIGHLPVEKIHDGTLSEFIEARKMDKVVLQLLTELLKL